MDTSQSITLLLISFGAFAVPLVSGRIGVPAAVGEIVFGILVGPHLLRLVAESPLFDFLAEFGFVFLMFLAGLELNFGKLERRGSSVIVTSSAVALAVFIFAFTIAFYRNWPLFLGVIPAAMSIGILIVALKETGIAQSDAGQTLILTGSAGEFLTILLVTFYNIFFRHGFGLNFMGELLKLAGVFVVTYIVLKSLRLLVWWYPTSFERIVEVHDASEVGVRAGLALMIAFVAISALLGVEEILGAFLAGALFSFVFRERGILETKLAGIGQGFFIPIFFIHVGTSFDLAAVLSPGIGSLVLELLIASLAVKVVASLFLKFERLTLREAVSGALLLSAPLTILVAIATIGSDLGVIDEFTNAAIILVAVLSSVIFPTIFKLLARQNVST